MFNFAIFFALKKSARKKILFTVSCIFGKVIGIYFTTKMSDYSIYIILFNKKKRFKPKSESAVTLLIRIRI